MTIAERIGRAARTREPLRKAELHCHIEGAAHPDLARSQAKRHGADLSTILAGDHYTWSGFSGFLRAYDRVAALFRTEDDYACLAEDHLTRLAAEGTLYTELFVSPDHARMAGLSPEAYLAGLSRGADAAKATTGILARFIVVGVRHLGPEAVEAAARLAATGGHPYVVGFGLAGDERVGRPRDFARAFDRARDAGLGLTAHAGEFAGPDAVRETLDALKVTRLGHGVRAIEDDALVSRLRDEAIVLEVCPHSNLALGVYSDLESHPLRRLHEAGVRVTVNSDDPPFFRTSLSAEYAFARVQGFSDAECLGLTRTAIEASFLSEAERSPLLERMTLGAISLGAEGASE